MFYQARCSLWFTTAARLSAAESAIDATIAGRDVTVEKQKPPATSRGLLLAYAVEGDSAIDIQTIYSTMIARTNVSTGVGSKAYWNACYHGELAQACVITARRDW